MELTLTNYENFSVEWLPYRWSSIQISIAVPHAFKNFLNSSFKEINEPGYSFNLIPR
jgi:hypothetical protein